MNKKIILLAIVSTLYMTSFSQTTKENINKAAKDPATKENAAKADVRLHNKQIIMDSTVQKPQAVYISGKKKKVYRKKTR